MHAEFVTVMYHYVREIQNSSYPGIKGLEFEGFQRQLDYLSSRYEIISADQLIACLTGDAADFPDNACLLTFDDGYRDHFDYVLPELVKRNLSACFFPPAKPIEDHTLLDVNAIHYILAVANDVEQLSRDLLDELRKRDFSEAYLTECRDRLSEPSRYDPAEVIFFKRMLQRELPFELRSEITTSLFEKYVGKTEAEFSKELYMTTDDLKELIREGMYVGSHTYHHFWLNAVDAETQEQEIDRSLQFLSRIGAPTRNWIMCYPYGAYNQETLEILKRKDCLLGFTTHVGNSILDPQRALELSRFDTNDFPQ